MSYSGRSPRLLMALASRGQTRTQVIEALYEELSEVDPEWAAQIDPRKPGTLRRITEALEELAPDGWPFGKNKRGYYGFWPLGNEYWPKGSLYDHL